LAADRDVIVVGRGVVDHLFTRPSQRGFVVVPGGVEDARPGATRGELASIEVDGRSNLS
jgi:hypothetical protein